MTLNDNQFPPPKGPSNSEMKYINPLVSRHDSRVRKEYPDKSDDQIDKRLATNAKMYHAAIKRRDANKEASDRLKEAKRNGTYKP